MIGHTGRGGFSHKVDIAFTDLPGVEMVAVADPDTAGREACLKRTGAARGYAEPRTWWRTTHTCLLLVPRQRAADTALLVNVYSDAHSALT